MEAEAYSAAASAAGDGSDSASVSASDAVSRDATWRTLKQLNTSAECQNIDLCDVTRLLQEQGGDTSSATPLTEQGAWLPSPAQRACGHRVLVHRSLTGYTNRAKQGGSQSKRDSSGGGRPRGVGAQLRRANEVNLAVKVHATLAEWRPLLDRCSHVFLGASKGAVGILYGTGAGMPADAQGQLRTVYETTTPSEAVQAAAAEFDALPHGAVWRPHAPVGGGAASMPPPSDLLSVSDAGTDVVGETAPVQHMAGSGPPLKRTDPRIRRVPFVTGKPKQTEVLAAYKQLRHAWVSTHPLTPAKVGAGGVAEPLKAPPLPPSIAAALSHIEEAGAVMSDHDSDSGHVEAEQNDSHQGRTHDAAAGASGADNSKSKHKKKKKRSRKQPKAEAATATAPGAAVEDGPSSGDDDEMALLDAAVASAQASADTAVAQQRMASLLQQAQAKAQDVARGIVAGMQSLAPSDAGVIRDVVLHAARRCATSSDPETNVQETLDAVHTAAALMGSGIGTADVPGVFMALGWDSAAAVASCGGDVVAWSSLLA